MPSNILKVSLISLAFALTSCGGGGGGGGNSGGGSGGGGGSADTTRPNLSFSPASLTVESGMTGSSTLSASDNVGITSGPSVTCDNGGSFDVASNSFTAPSVTAETTSTCTATARDAAGNEGTATLTVTVTPPPQTITLTGIVHKGAISGAEVRLLDAADGEGSTPIATTTTAADGSYSLTIPEGTQLSDLLVLDARIANAQMVCDAANCQSEGGVAFGSNFVIPADRTGPNDRPRSLFAALITPPIGTTEVNVNMFTHYQFLDMVGLALIRQAQMGGEAIAISSDYAPTRANTANVFALEDSNFYAIPFVDITQTISSSDQNAIYAGLLAGGLLGAALEAVSPFDAITFFEGQIVSYNLIANESNDNREIISLEDIFENASDVAAQIGATGNSFTGAQDAVTARLNEVAAASADKPITQDGSLPAVFTALEFTSDSQVFSTTNTGALLNVVNPDGLTYTATLETGPGSEFFDAAFDTVDLVNITFNSPPAGDYTLSVTFDTEEGEPNTDSIDITITAPEISIVEDSVTISKAQTDRVFVNINNPDNFQISGISISGEGSEFFVVSNSGNNMAELAFNGANDVPVGTYNITFDIESPTVGADGTDTVEVIVDP